METVKAKVEKAFPNSGGNRITVDEWNPSEFRIPDPPHIRVAISGGEPEDRLIAARDLQQRLEAQKVYSRVWSRPDVTRNATLRLLPKREQWNMLEQNGFDWSTERLTNALRVATEGKWIGDLLIDGVQTPITMSYPEGSLASIEELGAFPINIKGELIPLRAIATLEHQTTLQNSFVEDGRELATVLGTLEADKKSDAARHLESSHQLVKDWTEKELPKLKLRPLAVQIEDPAKDLTKSLDQLAMAFAWSIGLIFLTIVLQFGSIAEAFLVLAAVPLGLLGAVASLFLFKSTLSVNAVLGMILLNGIAVNNSIILVDFARRLFLQGKVPYQACLEAAQQRLRPILITSLTTILGMTPIALGFGTGGRVLQPLGIAVAGGLGLSMILTLFLVPALQLRWMLWAENRLSAEPQFAEG
jgi:HAE1 family hydrophobic/amphiphilic exporter-1/multidrug efflux pump